MKKSLEQRNKALDERLEKNPISESIAVLEKAAKKQQRTNKLLALSIVFDIILSFGLTYGWHQNHQLASRAESNKSALIRSCETSNEARAKNREIWNYVLEISNRPNQTPEQQKTRDDFIMKLDDTFAPRNCNEISNG